MTRNDNIHRKDGAEMSGRKFSFYDAADGSLDTLFTSKLQEEAQMGCLRGVFLGEEVGDDVMVTGLPNNKRLDSFTFRKELYELIGELQSGEMLGSLPAMIAFCQAHPEARMSDPHRITIIYTEARQRDEAGRGSGNEGIGRGTTEALLCAEDRGPADHAGNRRWAH